MRKRVDSIILSVGYVAQHDQWFKKIWVYGPHRKNVLALGAPILEAAFDRVLTGGWEFSMTK